MSDSSPILFDEALDQAVAVLRRWIEAGDLGLDAKGCAAVVVRDPSGRCGVLLTSDDTLTVTDSDAAIERLRAEVRKALGRHALPGDAVAMRPSEHVLPEAVLDDRALVPHNLRDRRIFLLDRLQTNQDWLRGPVRVTPPLPLAAAFSIKGGVGRSTAFAVLALALAREGRRVVVVDLDLEAPGIGPLLLGSEKPAYGVVDWLAETLIGDDGDALVMDMLIRAPAVNANGLPGDVQVMPAYGSKTRDYVAKLGRAYMPAPAPGGGLSRFADRLDRLVTLIAEGDTRPDIVLLDARAGLHDIGAAVVTQLGAQVFVFGCDEPQSWEAYGCWLEHLKRSPQIATADENADLRLRLKTVAAQLEDFGDPLDRWIERAYETWLRIYDEADDAPYSFDARDEAAPHFPLPIAFSAAVRRARLTDATLEEQWTQLRPAFEGFIAGVEQIMFDDPGDGVSDP